MARGQKKSEKQNRVPLAKLLPDDGLKQIISQQARMVTEISVKVNAAQVAVVENNSPESRETLDTLLRCKSLMIKDLQKVHCDVYTCGFVFLCSTYLHWSIWMQNNIVPTGNGTSYVICILVYITPCITYIRGVHVQARGQYTWCFVLLKCNAKWKCRRKNGSLSKRGVPNPTTRSLVPQRRQSPPLTVEAPELPWKRMTFQIASQNSLWEFSTRNFFFPLYKCFRSPATFVPKPSQIIRDMMLLPNCIGRSMHRAGPWP